MASPKPLLPNPSTLLYLFVSLTSLLPRPSHGNNLRDHSSRETDTPTLLGSRYGVVTNHRYNLITSLSNNHRFQTLNHRGSSSQSFHPADSPLSCYSIGAATDHELESLRRATHFAAVAYRSSDRMGCSHLTRVVATLKSVHPDWSLAAVRSAIMTTAKPSDDSQNKRFGALPRDSLYVGSIQIDPDRAVDPGLIYNMSSDLCSLNNTGSRGNMIATTRSDRSNCSSVSRDRFNNDPLFVVVYDDEKMSSSSVVIRRRFQRTVTNVGRGRAVYKVDVVAPRGSLVSVHPKRLVFDKKYEKKSYELTLKYVKGKKGKVSKGWISWNEVHGKYKVRSPIVIAPLPGSA